MKLPAKSTKSVNIEIADYYAIKVGAIWKGLKQESPAFWWLCIYFFFEYVRPQKLYPAIDILPFGQITLLITCLLAISDRSIKWVSNPGNVLFILFFIIVVASSIFAFRPSASFEKMDIIINWMILYFLFITVVNSEGKFIGFLLLYFLVNFKMSQYGFRSFVTTGYSSFGVSGSPGWFKDSGDLGIEMVIFVSLSAAFIFALKEHWGRYKKLLFYLLPVTGLITIIATTSRGAQLGMATAGVWFMLKSRKGIKGLVMILVIGWALYALIPERMFEEYAEAGEDSTSQKRLALWGFGEEVVRTHPVLGVGYFNWLDYCNYMNPHGVGPSSHCLAAHNTYITAAAELGITGAAVYVTIMLFILILNVRTRLHAKQTNNIFIQTMSHGLDGGLIGFAIATIFFTELFYPMLYLQLAMTVALYEISKQNRLKG